jgi:hypothetical protein
MNGEKETTPLIARPALAEVETALRAYWSALDDSELSEASKGIYMNGADNFVRWLSGNFVPGSRKDPYPKRKKDPIAS